MPDESMRASDQIHRLRRQAGYRSARDLDEALGIPLGTVAGLERGKPLSGRTPLFEARMIARALGCPLDLVGFSDREPVPFADDGPMDRGIWRAGDGIAEFERIAFLVDEWLLPSESVIAKLAYEGASEPVYHMYESFDDLLHPDEDSPLHGGSIGAIRLSSGDLAIDFRGRGAAASGDAEIKVRAAGKHAVTMFNSGVRREGYGSPRGSRMRFEDAWRAADQLDVDDILGTGDPSLAELERECIEPAGYTEDRGAVVLASREGDGR